MSSVCNLLSQVLLLSTIMKGKEKVKPEINVEGTGIRNINSCFIFSSIRLKSPDHHLLKKTLISIQNAAT